jgi:hypothetical protein
MLGPGALKLRIKVADSTRITIIIAFIAQTFQAESILKARASNKFSVFRPEFSDFQAMELIC